MLKSMLFKKFSIVLLFSVVSYYAHSQAEKAVPKSLVYLNWANDFLVTTDYYFSNGLQLGFIKPAQKYICFKQYEFISYDHFSVVQDMFTPTDLNVETILIKDRPYATYLYGSYQKHIFEANQNLYLNPEIFVGIIGKGAFGRNLQSLSHELTPSNDPKGWNNQIVNDLALNFNFAIEKGMVKKETLILNVFSKARLGTIYTDLSIGGRFRFGKFYDYFQSVENLTSENSEKWQLFFEFKPYLKAVGYNATMQGGVFNDTSPYIISASAISRLVGVAELSLTTSYKGFYFNGILTWNSKEFETAIAHQWITMEFGWAF